MALYRLAPDGLVACLKHVAELSRLNMFTEQGELVSLDEASCILCTSTATPSLGRVCYRDACGKPLHPRWPAVYCSNACAWADA